jgi:uncharacterized protein (DUF58 family)
MRGASSLSNRFIDPRILAAGHSLLLIARSVVEGFVAGLHRSPYHGFSLEFSEYREYSPGDDIRRVDWKVFGRSDRFYVKKYQGDTNTQMFIMLDTSASMTLRTDGPGKLDYGRFLAAALAYFAVRQNDAVGLTTFSSRIQRYTPPRTRHGQLQSILYHLEQLEPGGTTCIGAVLEEMAGQIRKRSLVVLISDLYEEADNLAKAFRYFHHRGCDVLIFHLLDPMELDMPLSGISTLEDMETGDQLPFSPEQSREAYLRELSSHIGKLQRECHNVRVDYQLMKTSEPLDRSLYRYLSMRSRRT